MNYCEKNCKESDEFTRGMSHQTKSKYINNRTINLINKHYEEMNNHKDVINEQQIEIIESIELLDMYHKEINFCYESIKKHYESIFDYEKIQKLTDEIQKYNDEIQNHEDSIQKLKDIIKTHDSEIQRHIGSVQKHIDECLLYNKDSLNNNMRKWIDEYEGRSIVFDYQLREDNSNLFIIIANEKLKDDIEKLEKTIKNNEMLMINKKFKEMDEKIIKLTNTLEINMKIFETLISYLENNDSKCKK
jgi:hypothetical protein